MDFHYTDEVNVQILIALMRHHGVRMVVASPGTTNITFVASVQQDPFFTVYSSADERSAAYMACGIAAETGEPVALSCTGATASRNYIPGLTEAFYRKLPVLAVTSTQHTGRVGHHVPQVIDRSSHLNDTCLMSVQVPSVHSSDDRWACEMNLNEALLELRHRGGGPVHVNLTTTYSSGFGVKELPQVRLVDRIVAEDALPSLEGKRVGIFVGAHPEWSERLTSAVDSFCAAYDAVVLCDQTSNYRGAYRVLAPLICRQAKHASPCKSMDVLVHIGEVSGAYAGFRHKQAWRVSPDGKVRDPMGCLRYVFEMGEEEFFEAYAKMAVSGKARGSYLDEWRSEDERLRAKMPELPFSNPWVAQHTAPMLPDGSVLHLGILNTLRSWNFVETPKSVRCYCNTGGFGIDGCVSSLLGSSLAAPGKLFFGVVGDLAFFYDMNSLGNRHVGANVRLMLINNGVGTEFKNYDHKAAAFGDDADAFMAARGHYGAKSPDLVRHYAQDLGFEYLSASTKEEFLAHVERFAVPDVLEHPILFEVFVDSRDESKAVEVLNTLEVDTAAVAKDAARGILGDKGIRMAKRILGR